MRKYRLCVIRRQGDQYAIALVLMLAAQHFTTGLTWETTALAVVNAFVVALAAFGSYELTFSKSDQDRHKPD